MIAGRVSICVDQKLYFGLPYHQQAFEKCLHSIHVSFHVVNDMVEIINLQYSY